MLPKLKNTSTTFFLLKYHMIPIFKWRKVRQPLAFMADEVGDIMYYHQAMNQPNAWEFARVLVKEVNGHVDNRGSWYQAVKFQREWNMFHPCELCAEKEIWSPIR